MHPETKKINTKKHALSNTNSDRKSKTTTKPWFRRLLRHPARKRSGSILGQTHTHLLTNLLAPDPQGDQVCKYLLFFSLAKQNTTHNRCILIQ